MDGLFIELPPFSPDYSGVGSVLFDMEGMIVIHGADGCIGNYIGYDEPRWYGNSGRVFSTGLREIDAVLGEEENYIESIKEQVKSKNAKFICILGTPPPMLVGTDFKAFASILEKETGLDVYAFDTNGIGYYDIGAEKMFLELAKKLLTDSEYKRKNSINIIGAIPIDIGSKENICKLEKMLKEEGYEIVTNWSMGNTTYEQLSLATQAEINLVISASGVECAKYMKENFNIPYYIGIPIGDKAATSFFNSLKGVHKLQETNNMIDNRKVLIIGEQVKSNAIRNALKEDRGFSDVTVTSFFTMKKSLMDENDVRVKSEDNLIDLTTNNEFDIVIGDPLYRNLIKGKHIFVEWPHIALSSRLYWDDDIDYLSIEGLSYLDEKLCNN